MSGQGSYARKRAEYDDFDVRRNPYLVDYEQQRSRQRRDRQNVPQENTGSRHRSRQGGVEYQTVSVSVRNTGMDAGVAHSRPASARRRTIYEEEAPVRRRASYGEGDISRLPYGHTSAACRQALYNDEMLPFEEEERPVHRRVSGEEERPVRRRVSGEEGQHMRRRVSGEEERPVRRRVSEEEERPVRRRISDIDESPTYRRVSRDEELPLRRQVSRRSEAMTREQTYVRTPAGGRSSGRTYARRKKRLFRQRLMVGVWILCALALGVAFIIRNHSVEAAGNEGEGGFLAGIGDMLSAPRASGNLVQGVPEALFAKHPQWEENFLTPNEYSRPGDALEEVTNLFVHYTANPGTSAAQNRSYFEQQKDTHEASVSAHFIIGYNGEIIQCVPLDEIAYAL